VRAPGWEVAGWEFVSDREPGSDYVFFNRENCPVREWAGPALMSGRVRVHLSRDTVRRSGPSVEVARVLELPRGR
jgi:hypothetical protein